MSFRDIRKTRNWPGAGEIALLLLILTILAGLLVANIYVAGILPGGEWFFLRWSGARAFLVGQVEPYSTTIAQGIQEMVYGRIAYSNEYAYVLNDPFYIVLLYTPMALVSDFSLARAIWMILSEAGLIGTVLFAANLVEWQPPRWLFILLMVFGLFGFFSLNALISGSPVIFLGFLYLSILVSLRSYSDELAGAMLFLASYQWESGGLFFLFIVFWVFANRRWSVLTGFGMSLFLLLVVSFLSYPGWGLPYIRAVLSDWYKSPNLSLAHVLSLWFPDAKISLGGIVSIVLGLLVFVEAIWSVQGSFRRIAWTASFCLAASPLMGFAIFPANHVVLILPVVLIVALAWERWIRNRVLVSIVVFAVAMLTPYGIYFHGAFITDRFAAELLSVLPPLGTIVGLYWMRWWVIRSPRTWLDQIGPSR